ncbi:hypothetical protein C8259_03345 [Nocardia nova]|uniref:Uncharacterized protein n=1 Tax=Nocardia nova TaxID=37330 RepID=A0A2T2ZBT2_9NOCA|nr:hypothetical protein C8259_03345 [Nocardia nova]
MVCGPLWPVGNVLLDYQRAGGLIGSRDGQPVYFTVSAGPGRDRPGQRRRFAGCGVARALAPGDR